MDQPRLHSSFLLVYILLILPSAPPPPALPLPPFPFRATVVFIDAKLRPGGSSAKNGGRLWRSWIDDFELLLDPWMVGARVLRNAAEEGTISRNNSGSTSSRSNSAVLPRLSTQIGRVFCPSSDPRYDDRPTDFCNWT